MCLAIHSDAQSKCVSVYINFSNWQSILLSLYVRTWWIDETQWNSIQVKICQSLIVMTYQSVSELLSKNAINLTNFNFKCSSLWTQPLQEPPGEKTVCQSQVIKGANVLAPPPIQLPWAPTPTQTLADHFDQIWGWCLCCCKPFYDDNEKCDSPCFDDDTLVGT